LAWRPRFFCSPPAATIRLRALLEVRSAASAAPAASPLGRSRTSPRRTISGEGQQILQRQAQWLQRYPQVSVTIEGHCDERGTREYNLALGERRAQAVKNVLVALGIPSARIQTISYGKDRPIVVGSDEAGYAQNRVGITTVNGGGPSS
jgi:peptidoglycan-associated lipoprotein